jgi:hypothetical protein
MSEPRSAFASDRAVQAAAAAVKAVWWGVAGMAARALAKPRPGEAPTFTPSAEPAPEGFVRRAWQEAFDKDAADVASGLYPAMDDGSVSPLQALGDALDFVADARKVAARRRRGGAAEAHEDAPASTAYPA